MSLVPDEGSSTLSFVRHKIDRKRIGPDLEILEPPCLVDHSPHHLTAGGIAKRMDNPMVAVATFPPQLKRSITGIEPRAPVNQLLNSCGSLTNHRVDHGFVTEPTSGMEGIGDVIIKSVFRIDNTRDTTLCPLAGRTAEVILRDDGDRQTWIDCQRRSQACQATTKNQHIREAMGHPLGAEGDKVSRSGESVGAGTRHSLLVPWR